MNWKRGFASDNNSGIHPEILKAIEDVNHGHCIAYGDDAASEAAAARFREVFGEPLDVYFVFTGTGANVLGIRSAVQSYESVICSEIAHLNVDECAALENFAGCKLELVPTNDGKISVADIEPLLHAVGNEHHAQPRVVSITQSTELGTVYNPEEIRTLADFVHSHEMYLHMDRARLSNAAEALGVGLRKITADVGVDILSFGGTKNGMLIGEAVVLFNERLMKNFKYIRKQGMHLASKMRFISVQFLAFLNNDLWRRNAHHANKMARLFAEEMGKIPKCSITQKVEANALFVSFPRNIIDDIRKEHFFYVWDESVPVIRLMTSFDTEIEDIHDFIHTLKMKMGC